MSRQCYPPFQKLQTTACTDCRLCVSACPAVAASGSGELSPVFRLGELRRLLHTRAGLFHRLFGKTGRIETQLAALGETAFRCTLCGNCQQVCPVGIELKQLWLSLREDLVQSRSGPKNIERIRDNLSHSRNVFNEDNAERSDWVEDMDPAPDNGHIKDAAEVVYFTGCVSSFFPMAQQIPMALAQILTAAGVDFTLLGEEEWCCGFPLLGAGLKDEFKAHIDHNITAVLNTGARKVVFSCPSCYQMWREYYPRSIEIEHATTFLYTLIKENRVQMKPLPLTITYHDPCDLGRGAMVYEAPRGIIRAIPGVRLVELEYSREHCRCCGGGGNLEMIDPKLSAGIAGIKMEEILSTGAEAVVSACQQCVRTLTAHVRKSKLSIEVMDIIQLVHKALAGPKGNDADSD
jgi:heterodisulfide reductase subunit D